MKIKPFIYFYRECKDAIDLYIRAFGAKATHIVKFSEYYPAHILTEQNKDWICVANLKIGDDVFKISDTLKKLHEGLRCCIEIVMDTDDILRAYDVLSKEGTVRELIQEMRFGAFSTECYTSVIDKFGVQWEMCGDGWNNLMSL